MADVKLAATVQAVRFPLHAMALALATMACGSFHAEGAAGSTSSSMGTGPDNAPSASTTAVIGTTSSSATSTGTGACNILASNYDKSCTTDSDCVEVSAGTFCVPACQCGGATINGGALPQFNADVAKTPLGSGALGRITCGCTVSVGPCCRQGTCQIDSGCDAQPADTLPPCSDAGGSCRYPSFLYACTRSGPPDACAYSDEVCCLP